MKCAVIFYHKNIEAIYRPEWIKACIDSIKAQTFQEFDVLEVDYAGSGKKYCEGVGKHHAYFNIEGDNHITAMNFLIDMAFDGGFGGIKYDIVFNINLDDTYHPNRFLLQYKKIHEGYQLVSSNFWYINHTGEKFKQMNMRGAGPIGDNLRKRHNVICHPVIAMHKSFWEPDLKYKNLLGFEDLDLWQRAFIKGKRFFILEDYLCNYRLHGNQVTKTYKAK